MKQKKILIEIKHGLGDCVCMIPVVREIRKKYPNAYIAMIVNGSSNKEIFERSGTSIDRFFYLSLKGRPAWEIAKTIIQMMLKRFDIGVLATMTPKEKGIKLFKLLGIKETYGEQYQDLNWLDLDNKVHFVDRNLNMIKELIGEVKDRQPYLLSKPDETERLNKNFHIQNKKIIVNIGGGDKNYHNGRYVFTRCWVPEYMVELVNRLSDLPYDICLLGGSLENALLPLYGEVLKRSNVHNCVSKTNISESIDFIADAVLSIGVDTGMQHIADAVGVRTLSIFGPTNPKTHGAYSEKAQFIECLEDTADKYCFGTDAYYTIPVKECMRQITSDKVYDKVRNILHLRERK